MRTFSIAAFFFLLLSQLHCQTPVGTWSDHLIYNTARSVVAGSKEVYASTGSSVIVYNKSLAELRKLSRVNGLTETGISAIAWSEEENTLIIGYLSTRIDLVKSNIIFNISDIDQKYIPGKKTINQIRTYGKYAYLACSFGIVVVDLEKQEIYDTWKPGLASVLPEVFDISFMNGRIYAATDNGVYSAGVNDPGLSYFGNWSLLSNLPDPSGRFTLITCSGSKVIVNYSNLLSGGDLVYAIDGGSTLVLNEPGIRYNSISPSETGIIIASSSSLKFYNQNLSLQKTISSYGWGTMNISKVIADNGNIWIADLSNGLISGENMSVFSSLTFPGPLSNNAYHITSHNGKTVISGGGTTTSWNNQSTPLQISIHENNTWSLLSSGTIIDALRSYIDPDNINHLFVSTWGGGLLEYQNNQLLKQYTEKNSPLQTIIPGGPYVRICGLAMDGNRNLWITQTEVPGSIKVLKPDGSWIVNPVTIDAPTIGDLIITKNGHKWVVLPRGFGLFALDDNNTPDYFADDRKKKFMVRDNDNKLISNVQSIAEDLDGNVWVGTDQGPLIYYNPDKIFDAELQAFRIKISRNDGSGLADYMLENETITSIAIDGANRKWLGTSGSGAYLISADGTTMLKNYNEKNSPILSNSIISLAVDNKTGEVWFGTSKGIQSVRENATEGEGTFSKIYSFPNPVREDFSGSVTITGLTRDSQVKITDISGNLVYETTSDGGQASWNLQNYKGRHVATGVYLVFCSGSDGTQAAVTKILVIK